MADELDAATELVAVIPELWSREVHRARYAASIGPRVALQEMSDEMKSKGDIIHLHYLPVLTVNDVTATTGVVANQSVTIADVSLTINKWKECTVEIVDQGSIQSLFSEDELANKFSQEFGPALGEQMDSDLFALYSGITYSVGSSSDPGNMTDTMVRASLQKLDELKIPKKDRNFVLSPKAFWDLFGQDKYVLAHMTGLGKGKQITGLDDIPALYGCGWYESANLSYGGSPVVSRNLLLHKEALALGVQKTVQLVQFAKVALSKRICGHTLYGVKNFRADHGIVLYTKYS